MKNICYNEHIMIDPELERHLEKVESELSDIRTASTGTTWRALWHGCVYGAGYVVGAIIIIVIVGWILNIVGVIPAFSRQVTDFRAALEKIGRTVK